MNKGSLNRFAGILLGVGVEISLPAVIMIIKPVFSFQTFEVPLLVELMA